MDLSVDPVTSEVYVGLSCEFIRTDAMCLECVAGITLHKPPQENKSSAAPPIFLASQSWAHYANKWRIGSPKEKGADIFCGSG